MGAPRSGTNMLRDVLVALPGAGTWPCDEINMIWRSGNVAHPTDELRPHHARPEVRRYVRRAFGRVARTQGVSHVVEKTCANCLRAEFVDQILPEAQYVVVTRDGRDAAASALRRWHAPTDWRYTLEKARFVSPSDMPWYGLRWARNRIHRVRSDDRRVATWGPRFAGMDEAMARHTLLEVCALQWAACVDQADKAMTALPPERVHRLRYEEFVKEPRRHLTDLADALGLAVPAGVAERAVGGVVASNVGKFRTEVDSRAQAAVEELLATSLRRHGYL